MKNCLFGLCLALTLSAASLRADDPLVLATWNVGLMDRAVSNLSLSQFSMEVDADILVLNEVKTIEDLQELRHALGREGDFITISSFENGTSNLEVGIISRLPLSDIVEFDPFPEINQLVPEQKKLEKVSLAGIADVVVERGFLVARVPSLNFFVIVTHLKSSRGASGAPDHANAQKREFVAAAIAKHVNKLMEDFPQTTIFVLGDFNVGVSDTNKNGINLSVDQFSGGADKYDETHALLKDGLVDDLRMKSLAAGLDGTFVGDDNIADFPGTGAIDVIYVIGPGSEAFGAAQRASDRFGSDHRAVFTTATQSGAANTIAIKKMLPNPAGSDIGNETITLENSGAGITVNGWRFRDAGGNTFAIPNGTQISPGLTSIKLTVNTMPLNNDGDTIVLLNDTGVQVGNPFSYTKADVTSGQEIIH